MKKITMGNNVRDKVTGFSGIVTAKCEYINGCVQFCVTPKIKKGIHVMPDGQYIDEGRLIFVSKGVSVTVKVEEPGGPMSNTPSSSYQG